MPQEHTGKCHLCHFKEKLKNSHIIPKCLGKLIRKSSSRRGHNNPRIYTVENGDYRTRHSQDTIKEYMLCANCEEKFSKFESYYSNTFSWSEYDENLYKFILSIFWREIEWFINFSKDQEIKMFTKYYIHNREEIRCFLNFDMPLASKPVIYMFKIEEGSGYDFDVHALTFNSKLGKRLSIFAKYTDGFPKNILCIKPESENYIHFYDTSLDLENGFSIANFFEYDGVTFFAIASSGVIFLIQHEAVPIPGCPDSSLVSCGHGLWEKNKLPGAVNHVLNKYGHGVNNDGSDWIPEEIITHYNHLLSKYLCSPNNMKLVIVNLADGSIFTPDSDLPLNE